VITDPDHGLTFGALDLLGHDTTGPYRFNALGEGTEWGNAEQIARTVTTFLQDGALEVVDSYGNRTMTIELKIVGEDSYGLALGEQALFLEVAKERNTLVWTPPNIITGSGAPCVFEVVSAQLEHSLDDLGELRLERRYKLTVKALPWAKSETVTTLVSPAPANVSPTVTLVDACTSTTGWTGSPNAATTSGGSVKETVATSGSGYVLATGSLLRSGLAISMTTTPYVRIDYSAAGSYPYTSSDVVKINGVTVAEAARNGSVAWYLSPSTLNSVQVIHSRTVLAGGGFVLSVNDISRSDLPQDASGAKQTYRTLAVAGSARTQARLALEDPAAALGSVLVYTAPNVGPMMQPPLRAFRTAGSTETADSTAVSAKSSDLATLHIFDIPASQVVAGGYQLLARVKHASAGARDIAWAARSRMGSTNDTGQSGVQSVTLAAGVWTVVNVAAMVLPTRAMSSAGLVRIELSGPSGLLLDEAWLFNTDTGKLTWVECGTATPSAGASANRLWLDPASLANPAPSVWLGTAADRSDAFAPGYPAMQSFGDHEFVPPSMNVFTVTSNSVATAVTLSYSAAFHTHVLA
jgi:hypothetical protein